MAPAITFRNVSKSYPYYHHITAGLKSFLFNLPGSLKLLRQARFEALRDVSFEVKKGETFGIIGRNGSGKSTILGLMAGVLRQDGGEIITHGRISSLLELGAGFHFDLSGTENIILNGILSGHTKNEMLEKVDEIAAFSELGDFIHQPLRTYSSGMHVRLAFSVAVHIDPEILLVDEALAVGDMSFQEKCMKKMIDFRNSGATIVIVSHDLASIIRLCDRVVWVEQNKVAAEGKPKDVVAKYIRVFEDQGFVMKDLNPEGTEESGQPVSGRVASTVSGEARDDTPVEGAGEINQSEEGIPKPSWWDIPEIMEECSALITGSRQLPFFEYLKRHHLVGYLDKGLSICNQLKGMEIDFVVTNVCKSFDVIERQPELQRFVEGKLDLEADCYEFVLTVDVLHRIKDVASALLRLSSAMKENGVIAAIEYIGPLHYRLTSTERTIAEGCRAIFEACSDGRTLPAEKAENQVSNSIYAFAGAVSSDSLLQEFEKNFDVLEIKYFGGPLYDHVLSWLAETLIERREHISAFSSKFIRLEQNLIREGVLKDRYAVILARKKSGL